jgi:hypothetical protein
VRRRVVRRQPRVLHFGHQFRLAARFPDAAIGDEAEKKREWSS